MKMSFWAGALAGFMLGSTKQGCAVRESFTNLMTGFFTDDEDDSDESKGAHEAQSSLKGEDNEKSKPVEETFEPGPLGLDKATELMEKLNAKVSEPQGEEALPHSHHIDIPQNKLSA